MGISSLITDNRMGKELDVNEKKSSRIRKDILLRKKITSVTCGGGPSQVAVIGIS